MLNNIKDPKSENKYNFPTKKSIKFRIWKKKVSKYVRQEGFELAINLQQKYII